MNKRKVFLSLIDLAIFGVVATVCAFFLSKAASVEVMDSLFFVKLILLAGCMYAFRCIFRIYSSVWRYADVTSYLRLMAADCAALALYLTIGLLLPDSYLGLGFTAVCVATTNLVTLASRFCYQLLYAQINQQNEEENGDHHRINIAIVGAGNLGTALAGELLRNPKAHYRPYCFVDIDSAKIGNTIRGLRVYADDDNIVKTLRELPVQEIVIALPGKTPQEKSDLYDKFKQTGCKVKTYDYPLEGSSGKGGKLALREFKIEDLLFRDTISINSEKTRDYYAGKTVLVTGGGGSIGSELCRQIAKCHPKTLVIFDIYENNAYDIQQELHRKYQGHLDLRAEIGSVRDEKRLDALFEKYRPQVVFHAAAHKHVPLMEDCPGEAIKNNILGTYNTANMAERYGVEKFILISTDKAVNPTNMMGASKRLCEMVVQCRTDSRTDFSAVRFGNVLGSNGSVIPLFRRQIASGGPITLTDRRIIRYFMTIPEASQLVMEAGAMAHSGELFVLDMGKPVKILDLAERMIQLSGLKPYEDIDIIEIGLRPGEKLYEELLMRNEELISTENSLIFIERDRPLNREEVEEKLAVLTAALGEESPEAAKEAIRQCVPTYHDPSELNNAAEKTQEMCSVK